MNLKKNLLQLYFLINNFVDYVSVHLGNCIKKKKSNINQMLLGEITI